MPNGSICLMSLLESTLLDPPRMGPRGSNMTYFGSLFGSLLSHIWPYMAVFPPKCHGAPKGGSKGGPNMGPKVVILGHIWTPLGGSKRVDSKRDIKQIGSYLTPWDPSWDPSWGVKYDPF